MSPEKTKLLNEKFPKIFSENFYFECGDGWFDLIATLCSNIQSHVDWKYKDLLPEELDDIQPKAVQVKEKFGGLRFYCSVTDDQIDGMISFAESYSYKVCEGCSNKASVYGDGWCRSHCSVCESQYQEKRNGSVS